MKQMWSLVCLLAFTLGIAVAQNQAEDSQSKSAESGQESRFIISERGAHHKVWERTEYELGLNGKKVPRQHSYIEVATGMHFKNAQGEWQESKEAIEVLPNDAGAVANQGQHKVLFPTEITSGLIEINTPDNQWLRSRVWGLAYFDAGSGESVLLAEVKESDGRIVGDNVVIYSDAFTDFQADLRYIYTKAGFEQDVVLRQQPPAPEQFNLNPQTTRLQVLTEFVEADAPKKVAGVAGGLRDESLLFDQMVIGPGKAFSVDAEGDSSGHEPVAKGWQQLEGRNFLIEEVQYESVVEQLQKLESPTQYKGASLQRRGQGANAVAALRGMMPKRYAKSTPAPGGKRMAKATLPASQSFVMDWLVT